MLLPTLQKLLLVLPTMQRRWNLPMAHPYLNSEPHVHTSRDQLLNAQHDLAEGAR